MFRECVIPEIINILRKATVGMEEPVSFLVATEYGRNPFLILIATVLSARSRDKQTFIVSKSLFKEAYDPYQMMLLSIDTIERIIKPIGFYHHKARAVKELSKQLVEKYDGKVPSDFNALRALPGVGPKTAHVVMGVAFSIPALCVDVHVHRISNRLGLVKTKTPAQTEQALSEIVPEKYWIELNRLLVMWGQNVCTPRSPFCSSCALKKICLRKGIMRSR